jgi:hypothetical protein
VEIEVTDLASPSNTITMPPYNGGQTVPIVQWFIKDGVKYYRAQKVAKAGYWYGIRADLLKEVEDYPRQRALDINHDNRVNISDLIDGIQPYVDYTSKRFKPLLTKTQTFVKTGGKQFIDGLRKGK